METTALEQVGLTNKEALVYLALAEPGSASASQLIQKTGLHRAVVYDILERLIEKGLASFIYQGKKKFFEAADPHYLLELHQQKKEKLQEIVQQLKEFSRFSSKLEVKIFKGKEGLITVFEDLLHSKVKEWLVIGSSGKTIKLRPYYLKHFQERRAAVGITTKALMINNKPGRKRGNELIALPNTEVRYLPKNIISPTVIQIYGAKTVIHSNTSAPPFMIVIENKDITDSFREYFGTFWEIAKK